MGFNKKLILSIVLLVFFSCVHYSFKGALPSYIKTIYIEDFEDNSNYPGAREQLMEKLTNAFVNNNILHVLNQRDGADLILSGKIVSVQKKAISFSQQEVTKEFHMTVTLQVECLNTHTNKPLWKKTLQRYGTISGTALTEEIDRAVSVAIDDLVEDIITNTIAAW